MNDTPKISVIVPVYRVEEYLERCVRSIMAQDYRNLEIILVDDGSPDRCGEMCDNLAAEDSRIRVLHTENHGLSGARNRGIDVATGELLGFVDSDDRIDPDMYSFLYHDLTTHRADIAVCYNYRELDDRTIIHHDIDEPYILTSDEALDMLMTDRLLHNFAWDKLYRRELFDGVRYPEGRNFEDICTTYKTIARAGRIVLHAKPKYHYTIRMSGISCDSYNVQRNLSYITAERDQMAYMVAHGHPDGARHLVRRGVHTIKKLIIGRADNATIAQVLDIIRPYSYIGIKEIGVANVWRRWMMEHHLGTYKKLYRAIKRK